MPEIVVPVLASAGLTDQGVLDAIGVAQVQLADPDGATVAIGVAGIAADRAIPMLAQEERRSIGEGPPPVCRPANRIRRLTETMPQAAIRQGILIEISNLYKYKAARTCLWDRASA